MESMIPKIDELRRCNPKGFSSADYVNYVSNISESTIDVARCFSEIYFPIFMKRNGLPFNESFGCYAKYSEFIERGIGTSESYYWSHVIDVESLLKIDRELASVIADRMCFGWNKSIIDSGFTGILFHKIQDDEIVIAPLLEPDFFTGKAATQE